MRTAIIIVDHGSRVEESNRLLEQVAEAFGRRFAGRYPVVEPAHMELAEPSIATAYARCVNRGGGRIVVCPFFLGPGKHWTGDIPRLVAAAHAHHPGTRFHVTPPLGLDDLILELLQKRVEGCANSDFSCDDCQGTLRSGHIPSPGTPGEG